MKKLTALFILSMPALGLCNPLSDSLERLTGDALAKTQVKVQVKLAKPVYMSEVMFRPVRGGKDTVIRTDYKQQTCTGWLSTKRTYVSVPAACVTAKNYTADQIYLTFADGHRVRKSGNAVIEQQKRALIRL